jgi:asparagine synthetase B (glutamine-hydrolysing)
MNRSLPEGFGEDPSTPIRFLETLQSALSIRTRTIPQTHSYLNSGTHARVAVLFSGGLDCSVLAWLIHTFLPPNEGIDLINVAFENPRIVAAQSIKPGDVYNVCPDRVTGRAGWEELRMLSAGKRNWRFIEVRLTIHTSYKRLMYHTRKPCSDVMRY